jgi:hypothetical protein
MEKIGRNIQFYDINNTWNKINDKLEDFISSTCGKDLAEVAVLYAECVYNREIKRAIKAKDSRLKTNEKQLNAIKTGPLRLTIKRRK